MKDGDSAAFPRSELYYRTNVATPASLVHVTNAGHDAYCRGARIQRGIEVLHRIGI